MVPQQLGRPDLRVVDAPELRLGKGDLFRLVGYKVYAPEVRAFHRSRARYRYITAPNRGSKSYAAAHEMLYHVFPPMRRVEGRTLPTRVEWRGWIVAPDYSLAKEFDYLYRILIQNKEKNGFGYEVVRAQNSARTGQMSIVLRFGETPEGEQATSLLEVRSGNNPKSLQSEELDFVIMSEAADQPEQTLRQYLLPRTRLLVLPTTPKIHAGWIRAELERIGQAQQSESEVFHFPCEANPQYDWARFYIAARQAEDRIKKPLRYTWGLSRVERAVHEQLEGADRERITNETGYAGIYHPGYFVRDTDGVERFRIRTLGQSCAEEDPYFAETFLGLWTYESERVLPFRWEPDYAGITNVVHQLPEWTRRSRVYVATDYGFSDAACALFFTIGPGRIHLVLDEIYEQRLSADEFVRQIYERTRERSYPMALYIGDPRKPEVDALFRRRGLPLWVGNKNAMADRKASIVNLINALSVDPVLKHPRLLVYGPRCPKTIGEWKVLRYKQTESRSEYGEGSIQGEDHAFDCMRYALQAHCEPLEISSAWQEMEETRRWILRRTGREGQRGHYTGTVSRGMVA